VQIRARIRATNVENISLRSRILKGPDSPFLEIIWSPDPGLRFTHVSRVCNSITIYHFDGADMLEFDCASVLDLLTDRQGVMSADILNNIALSLLHICCRPTRGQLETA